GRVERRGANGIERRTRRDGGRNEGLDRLVAAFAVEFARNGRQSERKREGQRLLGRRKRSALVERTIVGKIERISRQAKPENSRRENRHRRARKAGESAEAVAP